MKQIAFCALAALAVVPAPALAAPAPRMGIGSFEQLPKPLPLPYNETANADRAVAAARAKALTQHKLLLIDLGGNWCLDCRLLAGTAEVQPLKGWLDRHYVIATVDVGRFDKNLEIPARYGIAKRLEGVPSLLIVEPRSNRLLNAGRTAALADARSMSPQGLADWLASWVH